MRMMDPSGRCAAKPLQGLKAMASSTSVLRFWLSAACGPTTSRATVVNGVLSSGQPFDGLTVTTGRRRPGPIDLCVPAIAAFVDCQVWAEQDGREPLNYVVLGLRADVATAQYLYELLECAFDTETKAFCASQLYADRRGKRHNACHCFQLGLCTAINAKLAAPQQERAARVSSGRDLFAAKGAMIADELEKLGLDFHYRDEAFEGGDEAGARFEVVAGGPGFEPRLSESESEVLPLNYPPPGRGRGLTRGGCGRQPVGRAVLAGLA